MKAKRFLIIPIFLPFEGCEHRCIYCNQRLLHPENIDISPQNIKNKIYQYISTYQGDRNRTEIEVAFYGGSFTALNTERQIQLLSSVNEYFQSKLIDGIRFSTRPDKIQKDLLKTYKKLGVSTIEIGGQIFNDNILNKIKRNHTAKDIRDAVKELKSYGFRTSIHLMFGLPFSSTQDDIFSIEETIKLSPDFVRLHPTLVLKNTELEQLYLKGGYKPLSLDQTIYILRYAIKRFSQSDIKIIRVGLHNDEFLMKPGTIVAGPFHPSLKQLAMKDLD